MTYDPTTDTATSPNRIRIREAYQTLRDRGEEELGQQAADPSQAVGKGVPDEDWNIKCERR